MLSNLRWVKEDPFIEAFVKPFIEEPERRMEVDILENENDYILEADLPGIDKKDVDLSISDNGVLTIGINHKEDKKEKKEKFIRRERSNLQMKRSFSFEDIKEEGIEASLTDGVLRIKIPKKENEALKEKVIKIS